jgi:hypothetical protein
MFFIKDKDKYIAQLLDFEHSGVTTSSFLAKVSDLGNMYVRLWPNPTMQKEFLIGCSEENSQFSKTDYLVLKATIVFNTMHFILFNFTNPSPSHKAMFKSLLTNLQPNLLLLESIYSGLEQPEGYLVEEADIELINQSLI